MFKIMKNMSLKQKLDYIWTYYKFHIALILGAIILVFGLLNFYIFNPPPKDFLSIAFLGGDISDSSLDKFNTLMDTIIPEESNLKCTSHSFFYDSPNDNLNIAMQSKFMALNMTNELDIIICSKEELKLLNESEIIMNLGDYFTENELNSFDFFIDNNKSIGINIQNSKVLGNIGFDYTDKVLAVSSTSLRKEAVIKGILFILT